MVNERFMVNVVNNALKKSKVKKMYADDMTEEDENFASMMSTISSYSKRLDDIEMHFDVPLSIDTDQYYIDQPREFTEYLEFGTYRELVDKYTKNGAQYHLDKFKECDAKWEKMMQDVQAKALKILQDYVKAFDRLEKELERSDEYKKFN